MALYHFTDARNIDSIKQYGLLSWVQLLQRNIDHFPGSNRLSRKLDVQHNLQNYVRLCLRPYHPMAHIAIIEGRIKNIVWLEIGYGVTHWRTTLFSDDNATSNNATVNNESTTAFDSVSNQAEVLIHGSLNSKWITFP